MRGQRFRGWGCRRFLRRHLFSDESLNLGHAGCRHELLKQRGKTTPALAAKTPKATHPEVHAECTLFPAERTVSSSYCSTPTRQIIHDEWCLNQSVESGAPSFCRNVLQWELVVWVLMFHTDMPSA